MSQNRLATETSPYLLQHAENPVDWWPWCDEALQLAQAQDKPILLSIGYSACHWCHVMAHESFEDPEIAHVMNDLFINIKVDREERPDLDKIYQQAHQLLAQRAGGWPLTVFLTPQQHIPFFAGTYFPNKPKYNMPGFAEILRSVANFYHEHTDEIGQQNERLCAAMQPNLPADATALSSQLLDDCQHQLAQHFDAQHGGFGAAPKFPHPTNLRRLLNHWLLTGAHGQGDEKARHMLNYTLQAMANGGLYDQLGGGFFRYSVDNEWMIPHFEKMLYDNGPLLELYADGWHYFQEPLYQHIATDTASWVMREMQAPDGAYYSTLDADSEGEEGKFYVWDRKHIQQLLSPEEYRVVEVVYGLQDTPNFEQHWHLHICATLQQVSEQLDLDAQQTRQLLDNSREKLFQQRMQRQYPGRDEKILTAWNGLMIKGMVRAGKRLQREDFIDSAVRAVEFIRHNLFIDNRLYASYQGGKPRLNAYLDDYIFLIDALLELLQVRWNNDHLRFATRLADILLDQFMDPEHGGFYFTGNDHEQLFHRPKQGNDDAIPAGNGIAALQLQHLGHLLGETRYLDAAAQCLQYFAAEMQRMPYAYCSLLDGLQEQLYPGKMVIIRDQPARIEHWQQTCVASTTPSLCFSIPDEVTDLPGLLAQRIPQAGGIAYVCEGMQCHQPARATEELAALLA